MTNLPVITIVKYSYSKYLVLLFVCFPFLEEGRKRKAQPVVITNARGSHSCHCQATTEQPRNPDKPELTGLQAQLIVSALPSPLTSGMRWHWTLDSENTQMLHSWTYPGNLPIASSKDIFSDIPSFL